MLWPAPAIYGDWARSSWLVVASIFFWSGLAHVRSAKTRAKDIGMGARLHPLSRAGRGGTRT